MKSNLLSQKTKAISWITILVAFFTSSLVPVTVHAAASNMLVGKLMDASTVHSKLIIEKVQAPAFLDLSTFAQQVTNGNGGQVTGIYSDNLFAISVVQQPSGNAGYVAAVGNTATQFRLGSALGFLAHNYLAGSLFFYLYSGAPIKLVYGDGHTKSYRVTSIRKFQALSPNSGSSNFVDLATGGTLTAADLFNQTYGVSGQVVLQTCIAKNGIGSWGRLFVIATPGG